MWPSQDWFAKFWLKGPFMFSPLPLSWLFSAKPNAVPHLVCLHAKDWIGWLQGEGVHLKHPAFSLCQLHDSLHDPYPVTLNHLLYFGNKDKTVAWMLRRISCQDSVGDSLICQLASDRDYFYRFRLGFPAGREKRRTIKQTSQNVFAIPVPTDSNYNAACRWLPKRPPSNPGYCTCFRATMLQLLLFFVLKLTKNFF